MFTLDPSSIVRNVAVSGLHKPANLEERRRFWNQLQMESEGGVRGLYMFGLLQDASENEMEDWIPWSMDDSWPVRWCVNKYLLMSSEFPKLELTRDPDLIAEKAYALNEAYIQYKKEKPK